MDGRQFDQLAKTLASWRSRRQVVAGAAAAVTAGVLARLGVRGQGDQVPPTYPSEAEIPEPTQIPTEVPTQEPTSVPTEEPTMEHNPEPAVTETPGPAEPDPQQGESSDEQPAGQTDPVADEQRLRIAEVCQQATDQLILELGEADAYLDHPHAAQALGFIAQLRSIAEWGAAEATQWNDLQLRNYLAAANAMALGVRIGADAYYELTASSTDWAQSDRPTKDPETCIFEELAKWEECQDGCDDDDAACQLVCFWEFMVLKSCTRCMRSF